MTTRTRLVAGNWKMNTNRSEAIALATDLRNVEFQGQVETLVCPPSIWLEAVARVLVDTSVQIGGQDCWTETSGAFTGQTSPTMLAELCSHVIVGHSEHRRDACETDEQVARKADAAIAAGLIPLVCVGEDLGVRESGNAERWVADQVEAIIGIVPAESFGQVVIAYEPIWAIGSGLSADADQAEAMAAVIREVLKRGIDDVAGEVRILYGGSVKPENAAGFVDQPNVDGLLVGGASLAADSFIAILDACSTG